MVVIKRYFIFTNNLQSDNEPTLNSDKCSLIMI